MGNFGAAHGWGTPKRSPILKICHTYPTILKLSRFSYIKKKRYRLHPDKYFLILLTSFEFLKFLLINIVTILMKSAKVATLHLLKIQVFLLKHYEIILSVHDVINL